MTGYSYNNRVFAATPNIFAAASILPSDSILLDRTPLTYDTFNPSDDFLQACKELQQQIPTPGMVFLDGSWDPIPGTDQDIQQLQLGVQEIFRSSKVFVLSSLCRHFYNAFPGCVYFPLMFMVNYPDLVHRPRAGRMGCLNRGNRAHRVWLMHHLLEAQLIDPSRDIYSVSFTDLYGDSYWDVDGWAGTDWFNAAQQRWPKKIATHPDDFPNDYSIDHPAWHTGISIITETEPGAKVLLSEKTGKGILSKSCFSVHMGELGYQVLEDLGFEPRFFPAHAEDFDIEPILDICRNIATESQAIEYREQYIDQIEHNFCQFGFHSGDFKTRPWFANYQSKLTDSLNSL